MDYKEKYEQALARAKEILECSPNPDARDVKMVLSFFPELKESDDEKVRKDIISLVDEFWAKIGSIHPEFTTHDKMIAWLEKQAEQKPVDKVESKFKVGDKIRKKVPRSFDKDMEVARIEKDYYVCNHIGKFSSEVVPFSEESYYELIEHNPAWSEEDETGLTNTIIMLKEGASLHFNKKDITKTVDWLKSLKDRVQPQPKQEWSQNDIDMIDWLIRCCEKEHEELCNDKYGHQDIVSDLKRDCRKKWNWLESLKNKAVPQNRWKPSNEQLDALQSCVGKTWFDRNTLRELLEQLKKLREE